MKKFLQAIEAGAILAILLACILLRLPIWVWLAALVALFSIVAGWRGAQVTKSREELAELEGRIAELAAGNEQMAHELAEHASIAMENARLYTTAQQAREAAEAANRAKSAFLVDMRHELCTPLNAILGFSELMLRDLNLTARQRADLEIIGSSGKRLLALINDVLDLSKIETGRVELQERDFDLWHMLLGLEEMFSLRAEAKGLAFSFERVPSVPQYVRADENKLRQVLINLLSNAIEFTHQGSISLSAGFIPGKGEERVADLEFQVRDTGMGIAPEELDLIFDPFVQKARGQGMDEGTGLGMPISRQSARMMGGDLLVCSDGVGGGTSFRLIVPVRVGEATRLGTTQATRWAMSVELEPGQPAWRLLVVEDAAANRELLVQLLQTLGFDVRQAANGQEAITTWEQWEPHLVWMDVRMPVMDGVEATRRIKATAKGEETIVVALTASSFDEEREGILSAGCDDFVCKPFRRADILEVMAKHLGVRYIYRDDIPDDAAKAGNLVTAATLSALPAEWLVAFRDAVQALDMEAAEELVDQIVEMDELLARALADLITNFRFDTLQAVMEKIEW